VASSLSAVQAFFVCSRREVSGELVQRHLSALDWLLLFDVATMKVRISDNMNEEMIRRRLWGSRIIENILASAQMSSTSRSMNSSELNYKLRQLARILTDLKVRISLIQKLLTRSWTRSKPGNLFLIASL
jgi:hypothetical protein